MRLLLLQSYTSTNFCFKFNIIMQSETTKNKSGRPKSIIWDTYIKQGRQISKGHYNATCNFCGKFWYKGSPEACEDHLANLCPKVPSDTQDLFLNRLAAQSVEGNESTRKKRKTNNTQSKVVDFIESTKLTEERIDEIDRALVKAFVICGIPWSTIENPFFIELLKTLRPAYTPPSRENLSGRLLAKETAKVNQQTIKEIKS